MYSAPLSRASLTVRVLGEAGVAVVWEGDGRMDVWDGAVSDSGSLARRVMRM